MSYLRYVLRRGAFAVLSLYAVVTAVALLGSLTIRNQIENILARARYGGTPEWELAEMEQELEQLYGIDQPLHVRIVDWWVDVTTFDWGQSVSQQEPVVAVLDGRIQATLEYVIPGVIIAILLGVLLGLFAALAKNGVFDYSVRLVSYVFLGIPVFMLLVYMTYLQGWEVRLLGGWVLVLGQVDDVTLAALAVALGLLAGQIRFARASALEQTGEAFVKMLRAKGAGRIRLARHVLRNAAIPIISLSITELLAVLVLNIYVIEEVLGIQGLAEITLTAATDADIPLLIWATLVVVFLGIVASFLQDVLYGYLDPRIRTG